MDLSQQDLVDEDMEIIVKQVITKKSCIELWLDSNSITSQGALILADALRNNNTLQKLDLYNNRVSDSGVSFLVKSLLDSNFTLKILNLGRNGITNEGVRFLAQMFKTNTSLTNLYLQQNDISDDGVRLLANAIENHNKTLIELYLNGNRLLTDSSVDFLLSMIKNHPKLNRLNIEDCSLTRVGKGKLKDVEKLRKKFKLCMTNCFD